MNNYTRKWRHFNSKWKHSENTYLLVWWQRQTTDSIQKIWKSKASGQTTDNVRKIRKSKASDRVRGFLMCKGISRMNPWWYDSHVMCVLLSFQLSQMILYSAGFESHIRENFWFFALQIRIVCCLANARRQQECIPSYFILFVNPDSWKHASNYSQYLCRTQINFLSLILTDSWIVVKILEPNCLPRLSTCKIEKTTVQLLFSLFTQFSTTKIRSVFSHAKLMISWLKWLKKNLGCPSSLVSYSLFSTDRTQFQGKSAMFSMCVCTSVRKWRHKLCAVRMHNANVRNHLKSR